MKIEKLNHDASTSLTSEWFRMHEDHFALEIECDSLDAVDSEVYLEYAFDHAATVGIEVEDSRTTLDAADKHICIRNATPLQAEWLRYVYDKGSNTSGTINFRGKT